MQSYIFDFRKSTTFMKKWNKEFDVEDVVDDTNVLDHTFNIVLVDGICDDNFEECINPSTGQLRYDSSNMLSEACALRYETNKGIESIILDDDVDFIFDGENGNPSYFNMKGAFLTTSNGYVLGYSINQFTLKITTQMTFEKDLIFFDIVEGGLNG